VELRLGGRPQTNNQSAMPVELSGKDLDVYLPFVWG